MDHAECTGRKVGIYNRFFFVNIFNSHSSLSSKSCKKVKLVQIRINRRALFINFRMFTDFWWPSGACVQSDLFQNQGQMGGWYVQCRSRWRANDDGIRCANNSRQSANHLQQRSNDINNPWDDHLTLLEESVITVLCSHLYRAVVVDVAHPYLFLVPTYLSNINYKVIMRMFFMYKYIFSIDVVEFYICIDFNSQFKQSQKCRRDTQNMRDIQKSISLTRPFKLVFSCFRYSSILTFFSSSNSDLIIFLTI